VGDPDPDGGLAIPALQEHPARPDLPLAVGLPPAARSAGHHPAPRRAPFKPLRPTEIGSAKATRGRVRWVARGFCGRWRGARLASRVPSLPAKQGRRRRCAAETEAGQEAELCSFGFRGSFSFLRKNPRELCRKYKLWILATDDGEQIGSRGRPRWMSYADSWIPPGRETARRALTWAGAIGAT
jgi:hypothetical protein